MNRYIGVLVAIQEVATCRRRETRGAAWWRNFTSSHKIESIMEPSRLFTSDQPLASRSELDTSSSPLQLVFNALSTYHPLPSITRETAPSANAPEHTPSKVNGCCVVCGVKYLVPLSYWHNVEENIRPPTLLVPVRWVCISLAIPLPQVSAEDAHLARVSIHSLPSSVSF